MPVSPYDLQREEPTQRSITELIDKALVIQDKFTVEGAPYIAVDAPLGFTKFKDAIFAAYATVGWTRIEHRVSRHEVGDKLLFFKPEAPVVTLFPVEPMLDPL